MKQQILEAIEQFNTIIIHRHVRPDPDAYGSQCGLGEIIRATFPAKKVYLVGEEDETLHYLKRLDTIADDVYEEALVIVCDTANEARVCDQRYKTGKQLIKIDHHPNEDPYGDVMWVDTTKSSTSEMIYELYTFAKEQGYVLNEEAARLLYAGIVGDTGRFLYPSTKPETFKAACDLMDYGFSIVELYDEMYKTKVETARLLGHVMQHFVLEETGVGYVTMKPELLAQFGVTASEASQLVGSLGNIDGMKAWAFFIEEADQIRVRLRSKGPIINTVAMKYNGGGHPLASGASIYSWETMADVLTDLRAAVMAYEK